MRGKPRARLSLQRVAQMVDKQVNPYRRKGETRHTGFILITFVQGEPTKPRCVSTLGREELMHIMKLCTAELEGRIMHPGYA
jgi:hypothetical protein